MRATTYQLIARAVARGEISEAQGALYLSYAFTGPDRVPSRFRSATPWDGTLALLELQDTLADLDGVRSPAGRDVPLRGPSFDCPSLFGQPLPDQPQQRRPSTSTSSTANSSLRGLTIKQYAAALERTWAVEITDSAGPARRGTRAGPRKGRYPVRIENLGNGLYGYVANIARAGNNPATPWNDKDALASCMVLNRNFVPFPGTPLAAMQATVAHEFNHSIQYGYGALRGTAGPRTCWSRVGPPGWRTRSSTAPNDNWNYLWPRLHQADGRVQRIPLPLLGRAARHGRAVGHGRRRRR